jgi:protein-tyrosine phosphatase
MIDLHLHILPAVDDGADSAQTALEMARIAKSYGFTTLVATPHLAGPPEQNYLDRIAQAKTEIEPGLQELGIALELGFETKLSPDLARRLDNGERSTIAGTRTVLTELPFSGWPHHTDQSLFELQTAGYRPLLAHPERYVAAQEKPELITDLAERGVMLQVTFGSLVGLFGKKAQQLAEMLLVEGYATVLASDAHGAGQRLENVARGRLRAQQLVGEARTQQLVAENPASLLNDVPLPAPAPIESRAGETGGWRSALRKLSGRAS